MNRRAFWSAIAATGLSAVAFQPAVAQTYPERTVKIVVPFPAGGPLDNVGRAVADKLAVSLKQPFILENKVGAAGNLGADAVAKAAPDGHTLLFVLGSTLTVNPALYKTFPFNVEADLRPISIVVTSSQMLVVHPSVPVNSLPEFIAFAKKEPISYAHAGHGSPGHLAMEYFRLKTGILTVPVPYRGNAPLVTDLLGGQIKFAFVSTPGVIQHARAGKLKGLAVSDTARSPLAPDIPTIAESGYPGFSVKTDFILLAPAGTPDSIVQTLEREVRQALQAPELKDKFAAQDLAIVASTAVQAKDVIKADTELWAGVVKATNMQAQ